MTWACSSNNRWLYERGCRGYFPTCGVVSPCINHHFDSLNQFLGLTITRLTNHNHEQNTWDDPLSRESTIFIDHFHREIRDVPHLSVGLPHLEDHPRDRNCQWIGLRENLQESPLNFMGKSMVSCKFSLKPIQSSIVLLVYQRVPQCFIVPNQSSQPLPLRTGGAGAGWGDLAISMARRLRFARHAGVGYP